MSRLPAGFVKRSDGRLQYTFTIDGVRKYVYGKSVADCRAKELEKRQMISKGTEKRKNPSVSQFCDIWMKNRELSIAESTYRTQKKILGVLLDMVVDSGEKFGSLKMTKVTAADLNALQRELVKTRKSQTVNDYMALLRHMFKDARKQRFIDFDPTEVVNPLKRTEEKARDNIHRALSISEQKAFFDCERTRNSAYYNVYRLAMLTGMRAGEIGALRYSDIYNGFIHVERTVTRSITGGYMIGDVPKTDAGRRRIPLTQDMESVIKEQKKINSFLYGNVVALDDTIFKAPEGGLMMPTPADREIKRICNMIGIEDFTMHAFRATFATRMIEAGMNPKTLQEILGHANFNITMSLYGHCLDDTKIEEMSRIKVVI